MLWRLRFKLGNQTAHVYIGYAIVFVVILIIAGSFMSFIPFAHLSNRSLLKSVEEELQQRWGTCWFYQKLLICWCSELSHQPLLTAALIFADHMLLTLSSWLKAALCILDSRFGVLLWARFVLWCHQIERLCFIGASCRAWLKYTHIKRCTCAYLAAAAKV